jgi:hypothetical protein
VRARAAEEVRRHDHRESCEREPNRDRGPERPLPAVILREGRRERDAEEARHPEDRADAAVPGEDLGAVARRDDELAEADGRLEREPRESDDAEDHVRGARLVRRGKCDMVDALSLVLDEGDELADEREERAEEEKGAVEDAARRARGLDGVERAEVRDLREAAERDEEAKSDDHEGGVLGEDVVRALAAKGGREDEDEEEARHARRDERREERERPREEGRGAHFCFAVCFFETRGRWRARAGRLEQSATAGLAQRLPVAERTCGRASGRAAADVRTHAKSKETSSFSAMGGRGEFEIAEGTKNRPRRYCFCVSASAPAQSAVRQ